VKRIVHGVVLTLLLALAPAFPSAAACPSPSGGKVPALPDPGGEIVFQGRGWGHGTGMSQYGAKGAAELGCTHQEILSTYYPGATLTTRKAEVLRVNLSSTATKTTVYTTARDVAWELCASNRTGCSVVHTQPAFTTWIVRILQDPEGGSAAPDMIVQRYEKGSWIDVARHPADRVLRARMSEPGSDDLGPILSVTDDIRTRDYARGLLEISTEGSGPNRSYVNLVLGMEQYLYGLGEIPSSWHAEALRAQVVAGRTYAYQRLDARGGSGSLGLSACRCHLYATTRDQHYVGYAKETDGGFGRFWVDAVRTTPGRVLYHDNRPISAFYSSSHGGSSESYRFWGGGSDLPYLRPVDDSAWEVKGGSPHAAWAVSTTAAAVGSALGIGKVVSISLPDPKGARGRIGRPDIGFGGVVVEGTTGRWVGSGDQLRSRLRALGPDCHQRNGTTVQRLCSTMFTVKVNLGPPPVLPPAGAVRLTGDWNGDGVDTPGWFKDGEWGLHSGHDRSSPTTRLRYGQRGDVPVVGDWDGDGVDTVGVVRDGNLWILRNEYRRDAKDIVLRYGEPGDVPVVGDWDGNGTDTLGVVRGNLWILRNEYRRGAKDIVLRYGEPGDTKVVGDWDGNGTDTLGVVRGNLWILRNEYRRGADDIVLRYGEASDVKVTGDWDGNGTTTIGIVRGDLWVLRNRYVASARDVTFRY
jgi:hypothetical protein